MALPPKEEQIKICSQGQVEVIASLNSCVELRSGARRGHKSRVGW
jgi:hypothetical protein